MNLCLTCREVRQDAPSGLARAMCDLAQALAEAGHSVHLITDLSAAPTPELPDVSVVRLAVGSVLQGRHVQPESATHNLMHAAAIYREVKRIHEQEHRVDAVLAPLWRSEGAICLLDERFPTIVSCMTSLRTLSEVDPACHGIADIQQRLALEHRAVSRSPYLHGLTRAVLEKTIADHDLHPAMTAVIGRGLRDRAGIQRNGSRVEQGSVLFVGRNEPRKGSDTLLAAAGRLIEEDTPVTVTLAGPSHDRCFREAFEREASEQPRLLAAVRFAGEVSDQELQGLYEEADVVCIPSRYESHGVVLIEAMMFGKPIVTCDTGGIGEVAQAEHDALLTPPDDPPALAAALKRVLTDPELRTKLAANARETYEKRFAARAIAHQTASFLEEVVSLHTSSPTQQGSVSDQLEDLLVEVGLSDAGDTSALATELLDQAGLTRGLLKETALSTPPPVAGRSSATGRIGAVLLTRDRPHLAQRALASLALDLEDLPVLVIDNDSSPEAARALTGICAEHPNVHLLRSEQNLGCAGGRALGARSVESELVLLFDDDAELMPGALMHMLSELDANPEASAVSATVVTPDGMVSHSGGSLTVDEEIASFDLIGAGTSFSEGTLPPSGAAGWVGGTAVLVRRELLQAFPLDEQMAAYFEDNEWCYRISRERPDSFRRSREALALHHLVPKQAYEESFAARSTAIQMLAACARFYERHGLLLGPWLFDLAPELRAGDGSCDLPGARVLMELINVKGTDWTLAAWMEGDLAGLLGAQSRQVSLRATTDALAQQQAENARLKQALASQEQTIGYLHARHETLHRVEQGGWWRLRGRLLPLLRLAGRVRRRGAQED